MKLKEYLEKNNMSETEFAVKSRCSVSTICNIIKAKHYPRMEIRERISTASSGQVFDFDPVNRNPISRKPYQFSCFVPADLLTTAEAAEIAKVQIAAIYSAVAKGKLKAIRMSGDKRMFIHKEELERYRLWKYSRVEIDRSIDTAHAQYTVSQVSILLSDELKIHISTGLIHRYIRRGILPADKRKKIYIIKHADMMRVKDMFLDEIEYRRSMRQDNFGTRS